MAGESIRVVARIAAKPDKVEELKSVLLGLVAPTRGEKGCVSYQVCQSRIDAGDFACAEEWSDSSAIDAHMATPHMRDVFVKAQSLLASAPDIRSYSIIG